MILSFLSQNFTNDWQVHSVCCKSSPYEQAKECNDFNFTIFPSNLKKTQIEIYAFLKHHDSASNGAASSDDQTKKAAASSDQTKTSSDNKAKSNLPSCQEAQAREGGLSAGRDVKQLVRPLSHAPQPPPPLLLHALRLPRS